MADSVLAIAAQGVLVMGSIPKGRIAVRRSSLNPRTVGVEGEPEVKRPFQLL
jgi:hypothetical protein